MSWRSIQLDKSLCDQDQLILDLFAGMPVNYIGHDDEFKQHLDISSTAANLILIFNKRIWVSDIHKTLEKHLTDPIKKFYIGINRYSVIGNDTNIDATHLLELIEKFLNKLNYQVEKTGKFDQDCGQYFNFVQQLTWIYGSAKENQSH